MPRPWGRPHRPEPRRRRRGSGHDSSRWSDLRAWVKNEHSLRGYAMQTTTLDAGHGLRTEAAAQPTDVYSKVTWRLVPLLFVCYVLSYLDRINVGFAQLQMKSDLGFSDAVYGLGAGIFFIGYFLFEVPSNLLLEKIGARKTITRIMVIWGLVSACMAFVHAPWAFYVLRFFLGVVRSGLLSGHHSLFHLLVSRRLPGPHHRDLHERHRGRRRPGRSPVRLDHERSRRLPGA